MTQPNQTYAKLTLFEYELLDNTEEVRRHIRECEGRHVQQAIFSTFMDTLTQVCFTCLKVRSTIEWDGNRSWTAGMRAYVDLDEFERLIAHATVWKGFDRIEVNVEAAMVLDRVKSVAAELKRLRKALLIDSEV